MRGRAWEIPRRIAVIAFMGSRRIVICFGSTDCDTEEPREKPENKADEKCKDNG